MGTEARLVLRTDPKFILQDLNPQCDDIWKWAYVEVVKVQ